ncbi:hypothetical protein SSX86_013163 [Deinandra increscens subsp. villosa]|uniref:FRIGIDA-like protein n=1 Tax=Deinandra increscens subsp. villosa TaxID=3103831 RepID=A0AAP0DAP6_9ASTR
MEDADSVATLLESTTSKIQQLQKAFAELESHRAVTLNLKWKQIEEHFHGLEKSLKRRFTELEDQEKEFEMKTVQAQKVLEKRHAAVMEKEEASLVRLQEKRDVAVVAISNAVKKNKNAHVESKSESESVVVCSEILVVEEKPLDAVASEREVTGVKTLFDDGDVKLLSNPQLAKLCEEMDAAGLHKFISDNRKNLASIKEEVPIALKAAGNPGGLVLDSLHGFYVSEGSTLDGKKDSNLLGLRRTCIMLMECFSVLLANLDASTVSKVIYEDVKNRAKIIAQEWKPKLDDLDLDASNGNSLEAHAFLQLVATFGIHSDFAHEDLCKLIPLVCRRHQTADLCRFLGLSDNMPGVIGVLVNNGRHIDAVNLAFAFELTEQFSPVTLLKSYLAEAVKAPLTVKAGNSSPTAQVGIQRDKLPPTERRILQGNIRNIMRRNRLEGLPAMEDADSVATLLESTTSKIQQLQKAFAELESHRAVTLNLKWKQIEEHFHGLEKSLKRRFTELEDQEKEFEMKTVQAQKVLEKRHAAVMEKEEASLVRLQEKRDVAVVAISNAVKKNKNAHVESKSESESVVVCSEILVVDEKPLDAVASEREVTGVKTLFDDGDVKLLSNPQLAKLCEEMDAAGLHKFISDNRKNLASIKEEVPIALKAAGNPGGLVLDSLHGFYVSEGSSLDGKKDSNLLGLRRTCIMLMECFSVLLANLDASTVSKVIYEDVKNRAKIIAQEWKPKLDDLDLDASNGNSLEAHAFLQLVATFGIHSDFAHEDLCKLIPLVCRRHQTADLCRFLGLSDNMPGVIGVLVNNGRHIDAVNLAFAFELTEQFSPVTLLKSYLAEAVKAPSTVKAGNSSPTAQNDVSERELSALKAVTKCIEEHKLENQYPLDLLQKRTLQLEKAKADKKQVTEVVKPQSKRPRANGVVAGYGPRNTNIIADKNFYATRYAPPTQYVYYPGPPENHVHSFIGPTTYNMAPNHGTYFGNGFHYQPPYLH